MRKLKLFDFDGVLFDSMGAQYQACCTVLSGLGFQPNNFWSYTHAKNLFDWFREHGTDLADLKLRELFFKHYNTDECQLFDGVPEMLETLQSRGFLSVIVSANPLEDTYEKLRRFNILHFFEEVHGKCYKKADTIRDLCLRAGVKPSSAHFTGDMYSDLVCGREAGVRTIYFAAYVESPHIGEADHTITHVRELLEILK